MVISVIFILEFLRNIMTVLTKYGYAFKDGCSKGQLIIGPWLPGWGGYTAATADNEKVQRILNPVIFELTLSPRRFVDGQCCMLIWKDLAYFAFLTFNDVLNSNNVFLQKDLKQNEIQNES